MKICLNVGNGLVRSCIKHPIKCSRSMGEKGPLDGWLGSSRNQGDLKIRQNQPVESMQYLLVESMQGLLVEYLRPTGRKAH